MKFTIPFALLASALAASMVAGCNSKDPTTAAKPSAAPSASAAPSSTDPLVVSVTDEQAVNYKTGPVQLTEMAVVQEHPGRIEANETLVNRIGASVTGRVTAVLAELGDEVKAGQTLAQVSSPELTTLQLAFLRANANQSMAERGVDRARQLIQADVIGSAELQRRETELSISRAELRASEDQLRLIGLPATAIEKLRTQGILHSEAALTSRLGGVVIERKVSQGQVVQPGDQLFTVANLSNVWVVGALPEQAARSVQKGQSVEIEVPAIDQTFRAKVVFVSDTIQPETRTVAIRTQVDNAKRELKPQMLANLRISGVTKKVAVVPATALVRENDRDHVFVKTMLNTFRLTPVELGAAVNGMRPVIKGLTAGQTIIIDGGFHLNNDRVQRLLTSNSGSSSSPAGSPK